VDGRLLVGRDCRARPIGPDGRDADPCEDPAHEPLRLTLPLVAEQWNHDHGEPNVEPVGAAGWRGGGIVLTPD
jgi:hypothetical protein